MTPAMTPQDRATLAALADLMIPAGDGMPAASEAGVPTTGIDHVLSVRPDLEAPLRLVLDAGRTDPTLSTLRDNQPDLYATFGEIVAGAYFLNPGVGDLIGYHGRAAIPVVDDVAEDLLAPVIRRGPIYRRDPRGEPG